MSILAIRYQPTPRLSSLPGFCEENQPNAEDLDVDARHSEVLVQTLWLRTMRQMSFREVARVTGTTETLARKHMVEAHKILAKLPLNDH
ncbi:hypothetical protein [Roseibium polysiphoniae]|uniref:RNA polymerase sigma-70 region 4 domain-containing protein n=1 Tax=Roseibium polysiphoniae TaxID=2571221 RepID=A0ABR9C8H4_9HYPH|nr:hypothetical protein [Roseibium polysiphoniae]MBD8876190.1 hypothetical protein [Roseibium polysiphoniae]